jgi:hypothetical protein
MAEDFLTNVCRMIAGTLLFSAGLQASREMYGKSYFSLGVAEKLAVDQAVFGMIALNYQAITPDYLMKQTGQQPVGFQAQSSAAVKVP